MSICSDSKNPLDYVEVKLESLLPYPFERIFIRIDVQHPHDIKYFVQIVGFPAREVTKEYFDEITEVL